MGLTQRRRRGVAGAAVTHVALNAEWAWGVAVALQIDSWGTLDRGSMGRIEDGVAKYEPTSRAARIL